MGWHEYHVTVVIRGLVEGNEQYLWDGTHYCSRCQNLLMLLPVRKQSIRTVEEAAMEYYYLGLLVSVNNTFHVNVRVRGGGGGACCVEDHSQVCYCSFNKMDTAMKVG